MFIYHIFTDILESCLIKKCAKMGCAKPTNIYLPKFLKHLSRYFKQQNIKKGALSNTQILFFKNFSNKR